MRRLINKLIVLIFILCVCLPVYAGAKQNSIPEEVQIYAENEGFETFLEVSPVLNLASDKSKELWLGEGFPIYLIKNDVSSGTFDELLDAPHKWTYFIETADGETVGHLEITRSQNQLMSSGGGQAPYVSDSVKKMRELIQKYGAEGDLKLVEYSITGRLLYFSFGGDERVLDLSAVAFGQIKLDDITDYRQLPSAQEALTGLKNSAEQIQKLMEQNGGQVLYGGIDLNLSLHEVPASNPKWIIIVIAVPVLVTGTLLIWGRKRKSSSSCS